MADDGLYAKLDEIVGRLLIQVQTIRRLASDDPKQKRLRMKIEEIQSKLGQESPFFMASPPPKQLSGEKRSRVEGEGGKRRTRKQRKSKH
jgi:hypothetical protein